MTAPDRVTIAPRTWTSSDYARVGVCRTYGHVRLTVTGDTADMTPEAARDLAAALTRLSDSIDPEGAAPAEAGGTP